MKFFIQNQIQEPLAVEMLATEKVLDLKKKIALQIKEMIVTEQVLKFRSKTLNDSDTIRVAGILDGSVIELSLQGCFKILIGTESNATHEINVHFLYTAESIKKVLNRLLKIPIDQQTLSYNGKELQNGDVLTEKGITKPGTMLNLVVTNLNLQLNIVRVNQPILQIQVPRNHNVGQLKQMLFTEFNVPTNYQILSFDNQVLNHNNLKLADYKIQNMSDINFRRNDIEIFINASSVGREERLSLRVLPIDTVGSVKDQIQAKMKINQNVQQLIWNGNVLADNMLLTDELVLGGSTLGLVIIVQNINLKIQIGPERQIPVGAVSTETVGQLKNKIFAKTQIPVAQQILFLDNTKLEDTKMLISYGINEQSDIALERKDSFELQIESFTGKQITIRVHKNDGVDDMKKLIDARLGISPEHQRLLYFGKELENGTLEDYRIQARCTIHLVSRLPGGILNFII